MPSPLFSRLCLIGIGLIGSSLARAVKAKSLAGHIACFSAPDGSMETALRLGIVDSIHDTAVQAAEGADLVVLAVPAGVMSELARTLVPALVPGCILSDVGSVKQGIVNAIAPQLPAGVHLVPGHPIAGTEHSGPEAGFAELFRDRWCILTPPAETDPEAIQKVRTLWEAIGSRVDVMDAHHHDQVLAITSHLPHLIAYTIVGTADDLQDDLKREVIQYSASGFRDFTRIAASDPTMWRDIFLENRTAVLETLQRFTEDLTAMQRAIRRGDGETLHSLFTRTRAIRRSIIDARQA
ncbi:MULTISPECIES: prephenate/arogenate dehydrogenase family protein [unclassified Haematospirillum]|uniref:prephenate/arogenate dehydrogenase family protein n=1 Tax=unclassified Haematospirillum TaxID=2622088 RepID=UPI00143A2F69|nr:MULTISPECIES: prephenate/arogenate dehydrogenase family protein [unclassified Haematospirillum]NKD55250.1 prephenate/arogenate dehydrogenase family protein [Haematospirillum sp. H4890]NKD75135.1 prephenate/arogenate dehydrogenase family protein [Haematospirillum sp. H4485]